MVLVLPPRPRTPAVSHTITSASFSLTCALALSYCTLGCPVGAAEAEPDDTTLPGHSYHGEAFNEGPRQSAYLMGGTGSVHLPITAADAEAQKFFDQGVGQLHGYWFFEAERSFRQVAALDPACAMAYWGMAVANVNNETRAKKFIDLAHERKGSASPREQQWIEAYDAFYQADKSDDKARRRQLVRALESLVHKFPDELEARAFLCGLVYANHNKGLPITSHEAVDALIAQVLAENPRHPVHHYRIHNWDKDNAPRALSAAAECGPAAPNIAHMWHMPGHIYSKLKRYADATWQQEASARTDHAYMQRDRVLPDQIHNYAHNQEWLIRDLSHVGRAEDAIQLAKNLIELPRHPTYNTLAKRGSAYYGVNRLLEVLARYEMWETIVDLAASPWLPAVSDPAIEAKRLRTVGAAQFALKQSAAGEETVTALEQLLEAAKSRQEEDVQQAGAKARKDKKTAAQIKQAEDAARKKHKTTLQAIAAALAEVRGHAAWNAGDAAGAIVLFDEAGQENKALAVDKCLLARACLAAGDAARAEKLAREAVAAGSSEVVPLANLVAVLEAVGKETEAEQQFRALRNISAHIDLDTPPMVRLAPLAARWGLPDDWREAVETPEDIGLRPDLDTLGPIVWQPSPAPSWKLTTAEGSSISLADYRGRPVVVIFYLGYGCLHCVEQLKTFQPLVEEFRQTGIELVGISSESRQQLKGALDDLAAEERPSFPLAANENLAVFKSWRAYDDFEQQPLHGIFLLDGTGRIRWQDIGHEPFTNAQFLLGEAERLLSFEQ